MEKESWNRAKVINKNGSYQQILLNKIKKVGYLQKASYLCIVETLSVERNDKSIAQNAATTESRPAPARDFVKRVIVLLKKHQKLWDL